MAEAPPPRCDGTYGAKFPGPPLDLVVLGDSSAAGYGVHRRGRPRARCWPPGCRRRLHRPVRLHRFAVVGSLSAGLRPQVEAALERRPGHRGDPDRRQRRHPPGHRAPLAVRHLVDAVRTLRAAGAEVVVGTCPDLGTIRPIQPPLRWLARRWSRQLAAAQTVAVVEAGGADGLARRPARPPVRGRARPGCSAADRFHPSAEGYAVAAAALLPTVLSALGASPDAGPAGPTAAGDGVRSLPEARRSEAARHAGTEVSGARSAAATAGRPAAGRSCGRRGVLRRRARCRSTGAAAELSRHSEGLA